MSRASDKAKDSSDDKDDSVESDIASENNDASQEARQETPDLYRNSSLGMYVQFLISLSMIVDYIVIV